MKDMAPERSMNNPSITNARLKNLAMILKLNIPGQVKNFVSLS